MTNNYPGFEFPPARCGARPRSTGGSSSSSSTGGASSSSNDEDSDEAEGPDEPNESTVLRIETEQAISMGTENATASDTSTGPIELAGPSGISPAVTVSSLTVVPADGTDLLSGTVSRPSTSEDPLPQVPRGEVLAYVHADVDENVTADDPVGYVLFDYTVDPDAIPEGLDADDLFILRHAGGSGLDRASTSTPRITRRASRFPNSARLPWWHTSPARSR